LLNAIEWGGQLDPNPVRIACVRTNRVLISGIADPARLAEDLAHAAIAYPDDRSST
jgi:hypothetical protein